MRADDRYSWLDGEAAECLLRGRSAHFSPSADEPGASALAEALDGLAPPPTTAAATAVRAAVPGACDDAELPGETAALAAFRAARARPGADAGAGPPGRRCRLRSLGRLLRVGVAALALGGVLGGVAIAAGSGMLPAPFRGGKGSPAPAASVSAGPGGLLSPPIGTAGSLSGRPDGDDGREQGEEAGEQRGGSGAPGDGDPTGTGSGGRSPESAPSTPAPGGAGDRAEDSTARPPGADVRLRELCEKLRSGELSRRERAELELTAGVPDRVDGYCRESGAAAGGTEGGDAFPADDGQAEPTAPVEPGSPTAPADPTAPGRIPDTPVVTPGTAAFGPAS
ncbi:hypothetical protein [Streptomyces sp. CNQ085]|uniref:hypothetical protein n=1 Tax=Streptomyces sp. CNQ085 TaxID=2886944 RepID=UPI001F50837F|nr:hypothetical protein [Streptomyces sp. CNQ085]MCI0386841.1 hypothetical protein [Streptomyces sp. CNQ085]